ncbi:MAG: riboflavin biosynthesis protein RibF [Clostridia bacterium]|nr:riboflavin biosynthesis protein RibF [Clostridia bacterium]
MTPRPRLIDFTGRRSAVGVCVALGGFDGVHIGHTAVLRRAVALARESGKISVAFTFSAPPAAGNRLTGSLLSTLEEKLKLISDVGIDAAAVADFRDFADMSSGDFISDVLKGQLGATDTVCGLDFSFGKGRSGSFETLRSSFGDSAAAVACVSSGGIPVSSSRIRSLLSRGCAEEAAVLLGRPYSLGGTVFAGRGDGRRIGFPTVNFRPDPEKQVLLPGVYISEIKTGDVFLPSVTDCGYAPSLDSTGIYRCETHILSFDGKYPDEIAEVRFREFLRPESRFPDTASLSAAIADDVKRAESYFGI